MPRINPEIVVWARETAGLTQEEAAKKLCFHDSSRSSAAEKLAAVEHGDREPTRPQLVKMADQYRRPLLTFYLSKPPEQGSRGTDFRTLRKSHSPSDEALLDALIRDIRARQSMVRALLEDEDEAVPLPFIGSHRHQDGRNAVLASLHALLGVDLEAYRAESRQSDSFNLLREGAEGSGIFVLLKGDLGNYVTAMDTSLFRGFSIADAVAPFVVINDQDARPAWSFTLLHETVHLLLGQTGVSGEYMGNGVERFCDDVAGEFLVSTSELGQLAIDESCDFSVASEEISLFAKDFKVSRTMVAYKAYRSSLISQSTYNRLSATYRQEWRKERERTRTLARGQEGGPSYYTVRRHRLGGRIVSLVRLMMELDALSTAKAARILGIKPRQVQPLLDAGRSL